MRRLLGLVLLLPLFASAQSPFDGTWKVTVGTVQFEGEEPHSFVLQNGQYTCSSCVPRITVQADGTDQNVPGAKDYNTLAVKQVDDKTVKLTRKDNGNVVGEATETVSADGNTLTQEFKVYLKSYEPNGKTFTGKMIFKRVNAGPSDAHATSGSWRTARVQDVSKQGLVVTLKSTADGLNMNFPTGESYKAKFDGKDYRMKGDRFRGTVSLKKVNDTTIEETYKQNGKVAIVSEMTVRGNTLEIVSKDLRRGETRSSIAEKQQ